MKSPHNTLTRHQRERRTNARVATGAAALVVAGAVAILADGMLTHPAERKAHVGLVCNQGDTPIVGTIRPAQAPTARTKVSTYTMPIGCTNEQGHTYAPSSLQLIDDANDKLFPNHVDLVYTVGRGPLFGDTFKTELSAIQDPHTHQWSIEASNVRSLQASNIK